MRFTFTTYVPVVSPSSVVSVTVMTFGPTSANVGVATFNLACPDVCATPFTVMVHFAAYAAVGVMDTALVV